MHVEKLAFILLILSGSQLLMNQAIVINSLGIICFIVGYLGLATILTSETNRMLGLCSASLILIGTLGLWYHARYYAHKGDLVRAVSVPLGINLLVYLGLIGLLFAYSLDSTGTIDPYKLALIALVASVIVYTKVRMISAELDRSKTSKYTLAFFLSWLLVMFL